MRIQGGSEGVRLYRFSEILGFLRVIRTPRDQAIDQRLLALEQKLFKDLLDAVLLAHKLVLEEINKGTLVSGAHSQQSSSLHTSTMPTDYVLSFP